MRRISGNDRYGCRRAWLWALLGSSGSLTATGCIVPDADYCAFAYGDLTCVGERDFCVLAKHEMSHEGIEDGCSADVPEGFVHVRYGLPTMVAAPTRRPKDPRSVEGVLRQLGYESCGSPEELEASLGPAVDEVAEVRRHLEQRWQVRRAAVALSMDHVDAIAAFDEAMEAWLQGCMGAATETVGSTGSGGTEVDSSSTMGAFPCDCPSEAPFCDPATGECGTCDATVYPDGACRDLDSATPVCFDGACVECTETAPNACMDERPICDDATHICVPCTTHHECGEAACNLFTGACLPADAVVHVGGAASDFRTLVTAVASVPAGAQATIVVHAGNYDELVRVDDDRVLAFLAAELEQDIEPPRWFRTGSFAPQLTVLAGSTVLMDGIELSDNASVTHPGLLVNGGRVWVDRGRIVRNGGGGIVAIANAELTLRNCFVGGNVAYRSALEVNDAAASIVYTTLGAGSDGAAALVCSGSPAVAIRNSLIVSLSSADEIVCSEAMIEDSVAELDLGVSNVGLGPMDALWFVGYASGNFHLTPARPESIALTADWRLGDVRVDIDGDLRPARDGSVDYAGADVP